jgi:hypothetical protein
MKAFIISSDIEGDYSIFWVSFYKYTSAKELENSMRQIHPKNNIRVQEALYLKEV